MVSKDFDIETGSKMDIAYVMPAFAGLPGLEEAARDFSRSGAFNEESLAVRAQLSLVSQQSAVPAALALLDDDPLTKAKAEALSKVPVGPVGSYSAVQEIVNKIRGSNDPREVASLSSQLEAAINSTERLKGEEQDPEMTQAQINARREFLYNNDAEYRAKVDEIAKRVVQTNEELDAKTSKFDAELKAKGIKTPQDEALANIDEEIEAAKKSKPWLLPDLMAQKAAIKEEQIQQVDPSTISPTALNEAKQGVAQAKEEATAAQTGLSAVDAQQKQKVRFIAPKTSNQTTHPEAQEVAALETAEPAEPVKFASLRGFVRPNISAASEAKEVTTQSVHNDAPKQPSQHSPT